MLREISKAPGAERTRLERAGKGLQMLTGLIERRRQSGIEVRRALCSGVGGAVFVLGNVVARNVRPSVWLVDVAVVW